MKWKSGILLIVLVIAAWGALSHYASGYDAPATVKTFLDRQGRYIGSLHTSDGGEQIWTPLANMPADIIRLTLAAEDRYFYQHPGFNPVAIAKAAVSNLLRGRVVRGGSTITEQLAKNLIAEKFGSAPPRRLTTRLQTFLLALALESRYPKAWILERYLNSAYYGRRAYGIAAAARVYFGKTLTELNADEIVLLTKLPRAPNRLAQTLPEIKVEVKSPVVARHAMEYLAALHPDQNLYRTTLDFKLQQKLEMGVRELVGFRAENDPLLNAAVVVVDVASGDVLALLGSRDYFEKRIEGQVNVAVRPRQPGSALKPFTYFAAFTKGMTPDTPLADDPVNFALNAADEGYSPQNFDRRFRGTVTAREALANSYNVPAVEILVRTGLSYYHDMLKMFGFTTLSRSPLHYGLSVTLGSGEVTLLELTNAYAALSRGGRVGRYRLLTDDPVPAFSPITASAARAAAMVTDILSDPEARLKTFSYNAALLLDDYHVAVKTGTSHDLRDNWTVGYTADVAVGVWVGHNDNSSLVTTTGATGAGPVWHAVMEAVVRGRQRNGFMGRAAPDSPRRHVRQPNNPDSDWKIVSPVRGNRFEIQTHLPRTYQKIVARVAVPNGLVGDFFWYLDGEKIDQTRVKSGERKTETWLSPEPGTHTLRVSTVDGTAKEVRFHVLAPDE